VLSSVLSEWKCENSWLRDAPFLPATVLSKLNTARGLERGQRILQLAGGLQVSAFSLEMIEYALRDASTYARRWCSKRYASEHALRLSLTTNFASTQHQALAGRSRRPNVIEALVASMRSEAKGRAAQ